MAAKPHETSRIHILSSLQEKKIKNRKKKLKV